MIELAEVFDHELGAIQVRSDELRVRDDGPLELVERLLDPEVVPEDFSTAVVSLGTLGMGAQRFIEPGECLGGAPTVRGLHGLIQTVPVSVLASHHQSLEEGGGDPSPWFSAIIAEAGARTACRRSSETLDNSAFLLIFMYIFGTPDAAAPAILEA